MNIIGRFEEHNIIDRWMYELQFYDCWLLKKKNYLRNVDTIKVMLKNL